MQIRKLGSIERMYGHTFQNVPGPVVVRFTVTVEQASSRRAEVPKLTHPTGVFAHLASSSSVLRASSKSRVVLGGKSHMGKEI